MGISPSKESKKSTQNGKAHWALVGNRCTGKSAFVNAIRGLADDHKNAAKVGVHTSELASYPFPTDSRVVFWDTPGYDAESFPNIDTYWKTINWDDFDSFLIFNKDNEDNKNKKKMTEFDVLLAEKVKASGKPFAIVRTQIEIAIEKNETPELSEEEQLEKIKENMVEHLSCNKEKIFLINNYEPRRWDFFRLMEGIIKDLPFPLATASDFETEYLADVKKHISEKGVSGIKELLEKKLDGWKEVTIRFGITGQCGTGKSSFINTIRGINDDDWCAAEVDTVEAKTGERRQYVHPDNPKIIFVDLPGFGAPSYPDLSTYCNEVCLKDYDTFLIFTAERFTQNDLDLAKKLQEIGKSFFLIRTKIDKDLEAESQKRTFNEEKTLNDIKQDIFSYTKYFVFNEEKIFLISNHHPERWEFDRLVEAISNTLPVHQKEVLTRSLSVMTRGCLKRKVNLFTAQAVAIAALSAATGAVPFPGVSAVLDTILIHATITRFYNKLGLKDVKPENLCKMDEKTREIIKRYQLKCTSDVLTMLATSSFTLMTGFEEAFKYILTVGTAIAATASFAVTLHFLIRSVKEMEKAALAVWCDAAKQSKQEPPPDAKKLKLNLKKYLNEVKKAINEHGIKAAQEKITEKLGSWEHVDVRLAVIGTSGSGKSSFINTVRGVDINDLMNAAPTGVTETTTKAREYSFPSNPRIKFWDTPGIGGKGPFPDVDSYCQRMCIDRYHAFIIMASTRFTNHDSELAVKLVSIGKPFFFVRGKIDIDIANEKKKNLREEEVLRKIREDCSNNLRGVIADEKDIYLVSNSELRQIHEWDFPDLIEGILNKLSRPEQESLCLSMFNLTKGILERKVMTLKGRIWMVAFKSLLLKKFNSKSHSRSINYKSIVEKVVFYRSQLGFPEKNSREFQEMSSELQEQVQRFYLTDDTDVDSWLETFGSDATDNNSPLEDSDKANVTMVDSPYTFVYNSLKRVLDEMHKLALNILNEALGRLGPENLT